MESGREDGREGGGKEVGQLCNHGFKYVIGERVNWMVVVVVMGEGALL